MRYTVRPKAGAAIDRDMLCQSLPSGHVAVTVDSEDTGLRAEVCPIDFTLTLCPEDVVSRPLVRLEGEFSLRGVVL